METKFIEQLVTTAPESLREITHTLRVDVEALLKAKSTKKFLVLEPYSHILTSEDFFVYEPEEWDLIVSNPPFSIKQKVVARCLALGKPFALLLSNLWLNSSAPARLFREKEMQMLLFDKRIQFTEKNAAYFGSSYFCWKVLPKQIVFENLNRSRYEESRMADDMKKYVGTLSASTRRGRTEPE